MDKLTFSRFSPGPTYVEPWGSAHVYGDPFTSLDFSLLELKGADILSRNRPHPKYTQGFKIFAVPLAARCASGVEPLMKASQGPWTAGSWELA